MAWFPVHRGRPRPEPREDTPLLRMLTPADYVSLGNALLGLFAIFFMSLDHVDWAVLCIVGAIIGDGVDGALARRGWGDGPFGGKLDSFADLTAFGIAPAALIFHTYYQWEIVTEVRGPDVLTALAIGSVAALFVACAMLRLVRFEVLNGGARRDLFVGIPTPAAALVVVMAVFAGWSSRDAMVLMALAALFMVSRLRFPKVRGPMAIPSVLALLAVLVLQHAYDDFAPKLVLSLMATYVLIGPLVVRWRTSRLEDGELLPEV